MLALLLPAAGASAWTKEAAPVLTNSIFGPAGTMTVLPDGSLRYLARGETSSPQTERLVVRPAAGPAAFASPFPAAFGQGSPLSGFLSLSPADAAGNQLVVRESSPFGVAFLAPGADPAGAVAEPTGQVTAIDLAPNGAAAAIISDNSEAFLSYRAPGPAGRFDTPRELDRGANARSYAVGVTVDPDGGVFVVYETQQSSSILQAYAPPGGDFGAPQLVDVANADIESVRFAQSTNGRGILVWDEDTGGDTNSEKVWALTRAPGGLLGDKSLVATNRPGGIISVTQAAITDDGSRYVAFLDSGPISCPNNTREGGGVLALSPAGSSEWARLNPPSSGNARSDIEGLTTSGNAVGVLTLRLAYPSNRCTDKDPSSSLEVQLGQGAALGAAVTVASEGIVSGTNSTIVRPKEFAVNAGGAAGLLVDEPVDPANNSKRFLYYEAGAPVAVPISGSGKLPPAPGKIMISGKKLVARGGEIPFEASCTKLPGEGNKLFCSIGAILLEQAKREGKGKAKGSAASAAKGKKAAKPKLLATAKPVKVLVGKTGTVTLKLNKLGKKKLRAAKKRGLKVTLKVTIKRAGYATNTIERKLKLIQGVPKKKGGKKGSGGKAKGH